MDRLEKVEGANIDKAFIDAYPPGIRIVFNSGTGEHSPEAIAQALMRLVDRLQTESQLALQPLRLILITADLGEAVRFWNRELGLPEAGVSNRAVAKQMSWGDDLDSARSIVILHAGLAVGLVSGLSIATTSVIHEFGHVHNDLVRGVKFGFRQPSSSASDWPALCAHFAEITWSEFAAESTAGPYMTAEDLQELMASDPVSLAEIHEQLRALIRGFEVGQLDFPTLWGEALTKLSDLFGNLGRAGARFAFSPNGAGARAGFVDAASAATPWKPVVEQLFSELDILADTAYSQWPTEPFRGLGKVVADGFNTAGFFPIPGGQSLRVNVR